MEGFQPASTFPFALNGPQWAIQVIFIIWGESVGYRQRLIPGFFVQAIVFSIIPFLVNIGGGAAYYSCFFIYMFFGLFSGLCQGTVFALAANFPGSEMGMVMFGNGIAGIGSNALRAISLVVWPADDDHPNNLFYSALFNAIFASVILLICAFSIIYMRSNEYAAYYLHNKKPEIDESQQ